MKILLAALLCVLGGCANAPQPINDLAHRIEFHHADGYRVCGATAVGPNRLRTAAHCVHDGVLMVDGTPVLMVKATKLRSDVAEIEIKGLTFKRWAKAGQAKQGERARWIGNPKGLPNVYREGPVAVAKDGLVVVDATVCKGDSGSGIFNDRGELVGVISRMGPDASPCTFAVGES